MNEKTMKNPLKTGELIVVKIKFIIIEVILR